MTRRSPSLRLRLLSLILRIGGAITVAAFFTIFVPVEWMAWTHEALGLGPFPRAPIVDYLARSIALLYGFHGVLMLIVARDPLRYRPIVTYIAVMDMIFGGAIAAIDIHAGLPWYWTVGESVSIAQLGLIIAILNRGLGTEVASTEQFASVELPR